MNAQIERPQFSHEPLSDDMLGMHLAGGANHELKSAVLGTMHLHGLYTSYDLAKLVNKQARGGADYELLAAGAGQFCLDSFVPNGLVIAEEVEWRKGKKSLFRLTEEGERAKSLAGHMEDLSLRHPETSSRWLLGMTHSVVSDRRAPIAIYKLFEELLNSGPITFPDARGVEARRKKIHAKTLERAGFIEIGHYAHDTIYEINEPVVRVTKGGPPTKLMIEVDRYISKHALSQDRRITARMIASSKELKDTFTDGLVEREINRIKIRLLRLSRQGVLNVLSPAQKGLVVRLKPERTELITEFCQIIERYQKQDPEYLEEGRRKLEEILKEPEAMGQLIDKSQTNSPQATWLPYFVKLALVEEAERTFAPDEVKDAEEIARRIDDPHVTAHSVRKILKRRRETADALAPAIA